ncbi:MAG: multidrug effflux MFS transporter [Alphaproteobacteria bacterium]|nr:multidrug effflux MFS transporter [Alphaproteobacteria bacterium]
METGWRTIATLFAMMFASQLALTIYLPAVPEMAADFGTTLGQVQLVIPAYLVAFALMQLIAGPLSDSFGRKPVILAGLALFLLASVGCALTTDIWQLLGARFIQAAGACTTIVVGRAIIRDTSQGTSAAKAMSWLAMALGVGPAVAPFFGSLLLEPFGWRATFLATAMMSAVVLLFAHRILGETLPATERRRARIDELLAVYVSLLRRRAFMGYSLTISFQSGTFQVFITAAPIVLIGMMDLSPQLFGLYVMIIPAGFILASFISGVAVARVPINAIIAAGCCFGVLGGAMQTFLAVTGTATPPLIVGAILISNFGTGLVFANCYALALSTVTPSYAGAASALGGFLHQGWAVLLSLAVAALAHTSSLQMGLAQTATTAAGLTIFLLTVVLFAGRTARRGPRPSA